MRFIEAGYAPIPLKPNTKDPLAEGWQRRPPFLQWREAKEDSNIGLRAGNGIAFIDCDNKNDPETFANVINWMDGIGYGNANLPIVQTASGVGRHIYANVKGQLLGSHRNLLAGMGKGELRYGYGAFVATFPSVVDEGEYKLLQGDIARLPVLDVKDILGVLIPTQEKTVEVRRPAMSSLAMAIARGENLDRYRSASEAEYALVLSLIDSGLDYQGIKSIFENYPCQGHYKNKHEDKDRERWLYMTYQNALRYSTKESPVRRKIKGWLEMAQGIPWSRITDKSILIAHLERAFSVGRFEYGLDMRTVSLFAGVGMGSISRGTRRMLETGLIELVRHGKGTAATIYRLDVSKTEHILTGGVLRICSDIDTLKGYAKVDSLRQHDAFVNGKHRLGRRSGDIYELLFVEPLTVLEIMARTGACRNTVKGALKKLHAVHDRKTGEILELVTFEAGKWYSNIVDLELVAAIMGTYGAAGKHKEEYIQDRRQQAQRIELDAIRTRRQSKDCPFQKGEMKNG
jgi:hypothetical protein